jgi:hypothetical protein
MITGRSVFPDAAASGVDYMNELIDMSDAFNETIRVDRNQGLVRENADSPLPCAGPADTKQVDVVVEHIANSQVGMISGDFA